MPSTFSMKAMQAANRVAIALTGGRFGWDLRGMPVLEVTTTGRRSGEPRVILLTSPLRVNGDYVVVASRGGDDAHPAWFLNLEANPDVLVSVRGGSPEPKRARILEDAERLDVWERVVERHPHYGGYQLKTAREIPLVVFEAR
ncbi:nitroreductase/quinone reductase family protein [Salinibacterium soli]|uniref:Nitroreductase/quinone reductase family protein n=1 Tax=Antiquaquibacter soli TaxID=3064523 RepID=A0ABT9BPL7_9MICO|nr:nitroreductase/quinone reductase family protein [Protaetiibacter sp. WY-16]MDO7881247.1 nitroreductase/quinone reductase family protein [Protaetiibacter sp. WY-16]